MLCHYDQMTTATTNSVAEADAFTNTIQAATPRGKQKEASIQMSYSKLYMQRCTRTQIQPEGSIPFGIFPICVVIHCPAQSTWCTGGKRRTKARQSHFGGNWLFDVAPETEAVLILAQSLSTATLVILSKANCSNK